MLHPVSFTVVDLSFLYFPFVYKKLRNVTLGVPDVPNEFKLTEDQLIFPIPFDLSKTVQQS